MPPLAHTRPGPPRLASETVDVPCPECRTKVRYTVDELAKGRAKRCRNGHTSKPNDKGGALKKVLANYKATKKKLGGNSHR